MLKKGRKEAELSPADEGRVEGLINYFIVKNKIILEIFFLEEVNVKSQSRVVNKKTKPQGLIKGVQTISQPYEDSMMMKQHFTTTGKCNLCSSRQQQVLDTLRFILDRIKRCWPTDIDSSSRIDR